MVHSIVCYGLLVLGPVLIEGVSAKRLCKLHDRIIYNLFANVNESILDIKSICKRTGILQLPDLYKINACTCIFKILNENYAPFLVDAAKTFCYLFLGLGQLSLILFIKEFASGTI